MILAIFPFPKDGYINLGNSMAKIFLLFFAGSLTSTWACLQPEHRTSVDKKGRIVLEDEFSSYWDIFTRPQNPLYLQQKVEEYRVICDTSANHLDHQKYASFLIQSGAYDKAKKLLLTLEKRFPDMYETAANLGTTYELLGINDSALSWIQKGLQLKPSSHLGSEWLHVKILEAKIKKDTNLIKSDFLVGHSFGEEKLPQSDLDSAQLITLRNHIYYQLNERLQFVEPKDLVVGKLLFELGNIISITDNITSALNLYRSAKAYGFDSPVMKKRYQYFYEIEASSLKDYNRKLYEPYRKHHPSENRKKK